MPRSKRSGKGVLKPQKVLRQLLAQSIRRLTSSAEKPIQDADIYFARRYIKRCRATLRLVKDISKKEWHRRAQQMLRRASRDLSILRDSRVRLETFESVIGKKNSSWARSTRNQLAAAHTEAAREKLDRSTHARRLLERVLSESEPGCPENMTGKEALSGMRKAEKRSAKAFRTAKMRGDSFSLHEWRKRLKEHQHVLEQLKPLRVPGLAERHLELDQLSTLLGDEHDLAILHEHLEMQIPSVVARADRSIRTLRERLQRKALLEGERIYGG